MLSFVYGTTHGPATVQESVDSLRTGLTNLTVTVGMAVKRPVSLIGHLHFQRVRNGCQRPALSEIVLRCLDAFRSGASG